MSCETQLIQATQDWSEVLNRGGQTDVLLLDFSKAFDKVPHLRLAAKLNYYGIRGKMLSWIQDFLVGRDQCVVVNGTHSKWSPVTSGVPQGSVLGPTLFLLYINDIVSDISCTLRLFADDSILYKEITCADDYNLLQEDLNKVFRWADQWQMCFNAGKCEALSITLKSRAYQALVRPKLSTPTCVEPVVKQQVNALEAVQRQAARFVYNNYERQASVTQMLQRLEWDSLATRRLLNQNTMFFKIHHGLVNIPFPSTVLPSVRQGRASNIYSYQAIQPRVNTYRYSFFVRTIPVWNRLPSPVVSCLTVSHFQALALPLLRDMATTPTHQSL
ncbi:uncharacterized protein [Amphiura filiformis]|uniref:uncharacterized protein n=1 Tax=Amphiura filiformis TaxID=82378 RepID=UPI003B20CDB0